MRVSFWMGVSFWLGSSFRLDLSFWLGLSFLLGLSFGLSLSSRSFIVAVSDWYPDMVVERLAVIGRRGFSCFTLDDRRGTVGWTGVGRVSSRLSEPLRDAGVVGSRVRDSARASFG